MHPLITIAFTIIGTISGGAIMAAKYNRIICDLKDENNELLYRVRGLHITNKNLRKKLNNQ